MSSASIQFYYELLPEQKTAFIAEPVRKGGRWPMLGDGINDAPALSAASVGRARERERMSLGKVRNVV